MMRYLTLDDVDVRGRAVLVRADLNVPLEDGAVGDDFRLRAVIPSLRRLLDAGARVTVCSHLGRPEGVDPAFSLRLVAETLGRISGLEVGFESGGEVTVLENTRFLAGETENRPATADALAEGFDLFVQDAFGSVHRAHASTVGVAERVRSVAGPLLDAELKALSVFLGEPERPYTVVLGGAKVSDKLGVIESLLPKVDAMLVGGGMCFTLLAAKGIEVGRSLVEEEMIPKVRPILEGHDEEKLILPSDVVIADEITPHAATETVYVREIPATKIGLDIGRETASLFAGVIRDSDSVFWNGPMGVFEMEPFRSGTERVAGAMAESPAFTVVGGGDSVAAMRLLGLEGEVSHLSTGGGAGLELLEGRSLPGVEVLARWV